jgi:tetratricopeptide (TPR) repeat protein
MRFARLLLALAFLFHAGRTQAQAPAPATEEEAPAAPKRAKPGSLIGGELEDPVEPLEPLEPRTAADHARLDAMAWYGAGRVLQLRDDLAGAYRAYRRAIERDPTAIAVYRAIVPLAIQFKDFDDAAAWTAKAAELDPADYEWHIQLADLLIRRDDLAGAIKSLERAVRAKSINRLSPQYVVLMHQLGQWYAAAGRKSDLGPCLEVVVQAMLEPAAFGLPRQLQSHLQQNPGFERMGEMLLDADRPELALKAFLKGAETKRGTAFTNLNYNLAQVYLKLNKLDQALEELQKYIDSQKQTKGRAAYELLAQILARQNRSSELVSMLEAAAQRDSRNVQLQLYLAEQYAESGQLERALSLYKSTLQAAADPRGYLGMASVYRKLKRPADLLQALARSLGEGGGNIKALAVEFKALAADEELLNQVLEEGRKLLEEQPGDLDFQKGYVLANLAADVRRTELAAKVYRFLLGSRRDRANVLYEELGSHLLEVRRYADAAEVYEEAARDPALQELRPNFLFLLTQAFELAGETKRALDAISQAQQLVPNNPLLRFQEAWVYYHSHQFDEAINRFERLVADFPNAQGIVRRVQYSLSNIHVLKGDIRKGEEILEAIYRENPDDISVNNDLGYLYADQGKNLEQAHGMIQKALEAEPENAAYLDSMGWVLFKLGKPAEALEYVEKAVQKGTSGGDETLWDHLGDILERLERHDRALEAWKKALETAREQPYPDVKLIERLEEKVKNQQQDKSRLKPAPRDAP